jgi:hypothetical protein
MKQLSSLFRILVACVFALGLSDQARAQSPPPISAVSLNFWNFDDTNWLCGSEHAPVSFSGLVNVTNTGAGNSLLLDSTNAAWLQYNTVEGDGTTNLTIRSGTVMFWFSPSWSGTNAGGSGPGEWGRLIEAGYYTTNASYGWWSLYVDPAGANIYFSAQTNNGSSVTYVSAPITWTNDTWHHIAIAYSPTETILYLDGNPAADGPGITIRPGPDVWAEGFFIGSDGDGLNQARGMYDSLSTYDGPLDASTIGGMAAIYSVIYGAPIVAEALSSAFSSPSATSAFRAVSGSGALELPVSAGSCVISSNIWMTNVTASIVGNGGVTIGFTIQGGNAELFYDVFANASLTPGSTNYNWAWMGQTPGCTINSVTNLPLGTVFLMLGQPWDSDNDGLTDAYEKLVSKTDPLNPDSDGDGMLDGWEVMWGYNPLSNETTQTVERVNYLYDFGGWLDQVFGIRSGSVSSDLEGNILSVSQ